MWRAAVVGLGQIGMGYDLALDARTHVLTHARAFQQHPAFELVAGVDLDDARRRAFEKHYGVEAFADVGRCLTSTRPDVVAVATPTAGHLQAVREILGERSPKALLCEKPLALEVQEAREIVAACESRDCRLYVNYIRRSEPGVAEVERRLRAGLIGLPVKGVAWYSKGLFNNGSHFMNLLEYWLGAVTGTHLIAAGRRWAGVDPEPDFVASFAGGDVAFLAVPEENFTHCAVELVAANGRLRYEQGGGKILWQGATADPAYAGYSVLSPEAQIIGTDFDRTQWHVADQLASSLSEQAARVCTGAQALQTLETLASLSRHV